MATADDPTPRLTLREARAVLNSRFALDGVLGRLPSERDQNFSVQAADGRKYVLKLAKSDERRDILELQNAMIAHLGGALSDLDLPKLVKTLSGEQIAEVPDGRGRTYLVRLLRWVDGTALVRAAPHDVRLLESLGRVLARIDRALAAFEHGSMFRPLDWDLKRADQAFRHSTLLNPQKRGLIEPHVREWHRIQWAELRTSVIHGDANDHNVLVRDGEVVALLDFGDVVHSAVVCDLAVALAYVMLDKQDPITAAAAVAGAYHRTFPLTAAEADALFSLAASRLCMSVCFAALNARRKGDDDYQQVTAAPAWRLLERLAALPSGSARAALRDSCPGPRAAHE